MSEDKPYLGILLMLCFCVLAPLGDSIAKLLGGSVPLLLLLLARFAIQAAILLPLSLAERWKSGAPFWPTGRLAVLVAIRTLLHIAGIGLMFTSLRYLPLADAVAIAFVMPFILLLLGKFVLGEEVGPVRLAACVTGFMGTLLVIQPNFVEVGWAATLPLGVAVVFALFMLVTRSVARRIGAVRLQTVSGLQATALLGLAALATDLPMTALAGWQIPALLLLLGFLGTVAHLVMTQSLRYAPAATLAPMQYLEIPIAAVIGLVIFDDLPDGLAAAGIAVTVASGLWIIARERAIAADAARRETRRQPH